MNELFILARAMLTFRGLTIRDAERKLRAQGLSRSAAVGFLARHKHRLGLRRV
ncbi:MAG: hypothetical protein MUC71_03260 [Steroidobacteraceae bacterium]|jgi:hypothetical protein|nr:hypothetical protein [Steroidobacteraceae bacterium]